MRVTLNIWNALPGYQSYDDKLIRNVMQSENFADECKMLMEQVN